MTDNNEHVNTLAEARSIGEKVMHELMEGTEFNADDFFELCRREGLSYEHIKRISGSLFKSFKAAGRIGKTGSFRLSQRQGSAPLPIWTKTKHIVHKEAAKGSANPFDHIANA
jgi:hypothetical protein